MSALSLSNDPRLTATMRQREFLTGNQTPTTMRNQIGAGVLQNASLNAGRSQALQQQKDEAAERIRQFEAQQEEAKNVAKTAAISGIAKTGAQLAMTDLMAGEKSYLKKGYNKLRDMSTANKEGIDVPDMQPGTASAVYDASNPIPSDNYKQLAKPQNFGDQYEGFAQGLKTNIEDVTAPSANGLIPISYNIPDNAPVIGTSITPESPQAEIPEAGGPSMLPQVGNIGMSALNTGFSIADMASRGPTVSNVVGTGAGVVSGVNAIGNLYNAANPVLNEAGQLVPGTNAVAGAGSALGVVGDAVPYVAAAPGVIGGVKQSWEGGEDGMGHTNAREGSNNVIRGIMSAVQPVYGAINGAYGLANSIIKPNQTGQDIMSILNPSGALSGQYNGSHQYGVLRSIDQGLDRIGNSIADVFGTVICTQLHVQKRISTEIFKADGRFGKMMDESEYLWYLSWGTKIAQRMAFSQLYSSIIAFFFVPISKYMAGEMGVGKGSKFGKICFKFCQLMYRLRRK